MPGHWRRPKSCSKLWHGVSWSGVWNIFGSVIRNHP